MGFSGPRGPALRSVLSGPSGLLDAGSLAARGSITATDVDFQSATVEYELACLATSASRPGCESAGPMLLFGGDGIVGITRAKPDDGARLPSPALDVTTANVVRGAPPTAITGDGLGVHGDVFHAADHTPVHHGDAILRWRIP